jgi:hypothetical protein
LFELVLAKTPKSVSAVPAQSAASPRRLAQSASR